MKKGLLIILAAALLGSLCSCGESTPPPAPQEDTVAIEVGAQQVSKNEYYRYMYSERYTQMGIESDTAEFWASEKEKGLTYSEAAVQAVQKDWIITKLYAEQFDQLGLTFTAEETERFNSALEQEITAAGGMANFREQLIANRFTYEEYKTALYDGLKKDKVLAYYFGEGGAYAPKAEELAKFYNENYARIKMIMVSKVDSYYEELLPEDELADAKEKAEDAYAAAKQSTDPKRFNELISLYSADASTRGDGAVIHKSSEDEIAKLAFKLEIGEVLFHENDRGYYVIQRFDGTDPDVYTEEVKLDLIEQLCADRIASLLKDWQEATEVVVHTEVTELYRPENMLGE
ncbi:MAG: peptidylprolyl isomerase [Clostridia bacterium]|nr:peptidylprolyl isomerase [Clostridia bacterium]MBQ7089993.1 peptidylprolyl isomerase [Clostridia bacterium]